MAPNSLSPASVKINYHSAYGAHAMTIPTLAWFPTSISGNLGSYNPWTGTPIDAEQMVNDLVDLLKVFLQATCAFDQATVYTQATPTAPNIPQASVALTQVGTSGATQFNQAISNTFNFKTFANGDARLVLLDAPVPATGFIPLVPAGFTTDVSNLEGEFTDTANAWAGRDDSRPTLLRKVTYDLNDKLQKLYHLT